MPNDTNSRISGTGKGKPAGNLGLALPGPCPNLPCGVFFEVDSFSLLEISDLRTYAIKSRTVTDNEPIRKGPRKVNREPDG